MTGCPREWVNKLLWKQYTLVSTINVKSLLPSKCSLRFLTWKKNNGWDINPWKKTIPLSIGWRVNHKIFHFYPPKKLTFHNISKLLKPTKKEFTPYPIIPIVNEHNEPYSLFFPAKVVPIRHWGWAGGEGGGRNCLSNYSLYWPHFRGEK